MTRLKVKFILNKGRNGAPLSKLGRISEQADKFLRALAADCEITARPNEWLAVNFENGSVEYDAEFQGEASADAVAIFTRNLELLADYDPEGEGLNVAISDSTIMEYARIGTLIDPDEIVTLGIYPIRGGKPKLRQITYSTTAHLRKEIETPLPSYGAVQGILHAWFKEVREPYFQVRELSTDVLVRCYYPASLYKDVAKIVQERATVLIVSGDMLFDKSTRHATEMRADRIERMKMLSSSEFESLFGSVPNFTNELSTEEYIDETRANG